ncbi:MAG TPA: cysteate synthase [Nitrososphaera sp.]|nr:cysteate synthase [Nitrososphaera sp.]
MTREYNLKCLACQASYEDDGSRLHCERDHEPAFLVTEYKQKLFTCDTTCAGIFRYRNWLPIQRILPCATGASGLVTYQSKRLSRLTGLPNLWLTFNGYWPEKGAHAETATFKELEAYAVLARLPEKQRKILVISSAGSTAAAFALICSRYHFPCLVLVPSTGWQKMSFTEPLHACVKLVELKARADYSDAITLAERVACLEGFQLEGGAKNVGRRDGLGVVLLNAVEAIGRLPDYYFQAIGSGAGGIAVHQMAQRLMQDGRFGQVFPRLMLSQNSPFAPMYDAWHAHRREIFPLSENESKERIQHITASVLSNRNPPYATRGGVFDVLTESHGDMLIASNYQVEQAMNVFHECEGIDIDPAAGVALATLLKAASAGRIERDASILLNITGGGWRHCQQRARTYSASPVLQIEMEELALERTLDKIKELF